MGIDSSGNFYMAGERTHQIYPATQNAWLDSCDAASYCGEIFIIKANSLGVQQWARAYGPSTAHGPSTLTSPIMFYDLSVAGDDSLVAVGYARNDNPVQWTGITGNTVMWVMKVDNSGTKTWQNFFGAGLSSSYEYGYGVTHDASNNIYVTGQTKGNFGGTLQGSSDCFLMKLNAAGTQTWLVQYGGTGFDWCSSVAVAPGSGNIATAGTLGSNVFVSCRQSGDGAELWSSEPGPVWDSPWVAFDSSDNVLLAGSTPTDFGGFTLAGQGGIFLVKLNSAGAHQWTQVKGNSGRTWLRSAQFTSSGSIVALLESESTEYEPWGGAGQVLVHYDSSGTETGHYRDYPELPPGA